MKYCYSCKKEKDESIFNKDSSTKDGLANLCRPCDNDKSKRYHQSNNKGVFSRQRNKIKERKTLIYDMFNNQCQRCGSTKRLEFHHRDPATKRFSIGSSWRFEINEILDELAKCDLLCFRCHRGQPKHGTISMYVGAKCRCDPCVQANKEYHKNYRAKGHV